MAKNRRSQWVLRITTAATFAILFVCGCPTDAAEKRRDLSNSALSPMTVTVEISGITDTGYLILASPLVMKAGASGNAGKGQAKPGDGSEPIIIQGTGAIPASIRTWWTEAGNRSSARKDITLRMLDASTGAVMQVVMLRSTVPDRLQHDMSAGIWQLTVLVTEVQYL